MRNLEGRVAVVTGGASGIGEALARACARERMKVVVADIEAAGAERVAKAIVAAGGTAIGAAADVSDRASVEALADAAYREFGAVHLLCSNAGVLATGPLVDATDHDWKWLLGVNLFGVVNGARVFVPRMRAQGGEAHIVNTASIAGLTGVPDLGVYCATKHAVVGVSEVLAHELAEDGIGVSVLCPGGVETRIHEAARNRPAALGGPVAVAADATGDAGPDDAVDASSFEASLQEIIGPDQVAQLVLEAVRNRELYVVTHPAWKVPFQLRADAILEAYDRAADRRS
ncbi:MAG: SDR family NAD(P)-dependent oxidoreductase [Myxococcales bacterium]|nr:SDR family NAD(P)-dependent oxidoreductase [Myxococcales bacterium]